MGVEEMCKGIFFSSNFLISFLWVSFFAFLKFWGWRLGAILNPRFYNLMPGTRLRDGAVGFDEAHLYCKQESFIGSTLELDFCHATEPFRQLLLL